MCTLQKSDLSLSGADGWSLEMYDFVVAKENNTILSSWFDIGGLMQQLAERFEVAFKKNTFTQFY